MEEFLRAFAEILDVEADAVTLDSDFKTFSDWDSLAQISVMALIEDVYKKSVGPSIFDRSTTVSDLISNVKAS